MYTHGNRKVHHPLSAKAVKGHGSGPEWAEADDPIMPAKTIALAEHGMHGTKDGIKAIKHVPAVQHEALHTKISIEEDDEEEVDDMSEQDDVEVACEHMIAEVLRAGEVILDLGSPSGIVSHPITHADLNMLISALSARAHEIGACTTVLRRHDLADEEGGAAQAADVLVRAMPATRSAIEVRAAVIGNVDSGKSTMVGVLTRGMLDDGRGAARGVVFNHAHEASTGRTSSIGQHHLCMDATNTIINDTSFKTATTASYIERAAKVVTLMDLAGHEKYFKTTAYGLTGHMPDYACVVIGANAGMVGMCKEHLSIALALKVPVFFVITKVDLCPAHILKETLSGLTGVLRKPRVRRRPFAVRTARDVLTAMRGMEAGGLAPVFKTSAVSGEGLDLLRMFVGLLPQRVDWAAMAKEPAEFVVDETFAVPGVGTVVSGTLKRGVITPQSKLLLGPDVADGGFHPVAIRSIQYKRLPVPSVTAGQTAALALKKIKRTAVRKGMVLADAALAPQAVWEFDADVAVLTHSTTIQLRYQAVVHCEIIRASARVIAMDCDRLRSGDRSVVRFRFLQRPEYVRCGARFVFREGHTKGIGMIVGTGGDSGI